MRRRMRLLMLRIGIRRFSTRGVGGIESEKWDGDWEEGGGGRGLGFGVLDGGLVEVGGRGCGE